jgi:hypothetical protein
VRFSCCCGGVRFVVCQREPEIRRQALASPNAVVQLLLMLNIAAFLSHGWIDANFCQSIAKVNAIVELRDLRLSGDKWPACCVVSRLCRLVSRISAHVMIDWLGAKPHRLAGMTGWPGICSDVPRPHRIPTHVFHLHFAHQSVESLRKQAALITQKLC